MENSAVANNKAAVPPGELFGSSRVDVLSCGWRHGRSWWHHCWQVMFSSVPERGCPSSLSGSHPPSVLFFPSIFFLITWHVFSAGTKTSRDVSSTFCSGPPVYIWPLISSPSVLRGTFSIIISGNVWNIPPENQVEMLLQQLIFLGRQTKTKKGEDSSYSHL